MSGSPCPVSAAGGYSAPQAGSPSTGESLPPAGEDEYYVVDLIGFEVEEEGGRQLGRVTDVAPGVANDVLELDSGVLLPMVEDCMLQVDTDRRKILVAPGFADPG